MPIHIVISTPQEIFAQAVGTAKDLSEKIMKLSDLNVSPLSPGETADARRHQIAKFGKALAEAFIVINGIIEASAEAVAAKHHGDVTSGPVSNAPPDSDAN